MRKLKTRRLFRLLFVLAGALLLLAAFAPNANAQSLIAYYNFEGAPTSPYPVNLQSHVPAFFSSGNNLILTYNPGNTSAQVGLPENLFPGDPAPNLTGLGLSASGANSPANFTIPLFSSQGFFSNMTLSFAINAAGNGFNLATLQYSTNGGGTFTTFSMTAVPNSGTIVVSGAVPALANNQPLLELRIVLSGGQSNGNNLQNVLDNIQVTGTVVPEPATVAGGLLGVLGLCWFQRRRFG